MRECFIKLNGKTGYRYHEIGHCAGDIMWWVDNKGKVRTQVSTGMDFHHALDKRVNFDLRWRGRLILRLHLATMLPPIGYYDDDRNTPDKIYLAYRTMQQLQLLGVKRFWIDTPLGMSVANWSGETGKEIES